MKRADLYRLKGVFEGFGNIEDVDFAYVIVKNLKLIEKEIEILEEIRKPSKEFDEKIQNKVNDLIRKYGKKDDKGNLVPDNQGNVQLDLDRKDEFEKEVTELEKGNKELVEKRTEQLKEFNRLLEEEVDIELVKVKKKNLPKDIKVSELYNISEIVEDL